MRAKKFLYVLIAVLITMAAVTAVPVFAEETARNGDAYIWYNDATGDEYVISDAEELYAFADLVNSGTDFSKKTVKLASDIDLNNAVWTPIGNSSAHFRGSFDGQNHTISNLNVDMESKSYVGLFGYTSGGEVKNLTVHNASVKGYLGVGVIAGCPYTSDMTNLTVTGVVKVDGYAYVGGMLGRNFYADGTDLTIDVTAGSYVRAESENYRTYVGGVIGFMGEGSQTVQNVRSNIDVYGSTCDIGGITGIAHYGNSFINCICYGNVCVTSYIDDGDQLESGGIAGVWHNQTGYTVTFKDCYFEGELSAVKADGTVYSGEFENGGLFGAAYSSSQTGTIVVDNKIVRIGDTYYATFAEALSAAGALLDGGESSVTLTLLGDIITEETLNINESITLDLNGYTLVPAGCNAGDGWNVKIGGNADVKIVNGVLDLTDVSGGWHGIIGIGAGTLELDSTVSVIGSNMSGNVFALTNGASVLTLNGTTVDIISQNGGNGVYFIKGEPDSGVPKAVICGADITIENGQGGFNTLNINILNSSVSMIGMAQHGFRNISGSLDNADIVIDTLEDGIKNTGDQVLVIKGNGFVDINAETEYNIAENASFEIEGGIFTADPKEYVINGKESYYDKNTGYYTVENRRPINVVTVLPVVPGTEVDTHYAYILGFEDGSIRPENNLTRAEAATVIFRILDDDVRKSALSRENRFSDVAEDAWYNTAVSTLAGLGIINGRTDDTFAPDDNITRAEFTAMIVRLYNISGTSSGIFADVAGHWAEDLICLAASAGLVEGSGGRFRPDDNINRAEAMAIVNRAEGRVPDSESDMLAGMKVWSDNTDKNAWYYLTVQEATNSHTCTSGSDAGAEKWVEIIADPDWKEIEK